MHEYILLIPLYRMGFGDAIDTSTPAYFDIHFIRLNSQEAADQLLSGTALSDLPASAVVVSGEVRAPDGTAPEPGSLGSPAIKSLDDGLTVVAHALANPSSVLAQNGFRSDTPVYILHRGRRAVKAISPTEGE
jgi:hypothetical protein